VPESDSVGQLVIYQLSLINNQWYWAPGT